MKSEEDEAFDDLAKRQGAWGGGFKAKQAMAKARIDDDDDIQDYKKPWVDLTPEEIDEGNKQSWVSKQAWQSAVWWASEKLKEKNT